MVAGDEVVVPEGVPPQPGSRSTASASTPAVLAIVLTRERRVIVEFLSYIGLGHILGSDTLKA